MAVSPALAHGGARAPATKQEADEEMMPAAEAAGAPQARDDGAGQQREALGEKKEPEAERVATKTPARVPKYKRT